MYPIRRVSGRLVSDLEPAANPVPDGPVTHTQLLHEVQQ